MGGQNGNPPSFLSPIFPAFTKNFVRPFFQKGTKNPILGFYPIFPHYPKMVIALLFYVFGYFALKFTD